MRIYKLLLEWASPPYLLRRTAFLIGISTLVTAILSGCRDFENDRITPTTNLQPGRGSATVTAVPNLHSDQPTETALAPVGAFYGYTAHRGDGNRYVSGMGNLPGSEPLDIPLAGGPVWLVAAHNGENGLWVAALEDGRLQAFEVSPGNSGREVQEIEIKPERLPPGMPPLLRVVEGQPQVIAPPGDDFSPLTHPVVLGGAEGGLAYVAANGDMVVQQGGETVRLEVEALPDARLLLDEAGRILLLTQPTSRYDHAVLGDGIEAGGITMIETHPEARIAITIPIPQPSVVEGIAPIWADLTGDGNREIIVTLSDRSRGARIAVYDYRGELLAAGLEIGQGYRWRNQMAVGPFGPHGSLELTSVLTPHLSGVVEFIELKGSRLTTAANLAGYSSHVIGSRNLDMALSGDFDGDAHPEVVVPNLALTQLIAIRHTENGAQEVWTLPTGGTVSTNLAAITYPGGGIALGIGTDERMLRIWGP